MAHEAEEGARELLKRICGAPLATPAWLKRPGKVECGSRWDLVRTIYKALTGKQLSATMPPRERRLVDGVFLFEGTCFIYELDEVQHFNSFRATTLAHYPDDLRVGFDKAAWLHRCATKKKLEAGGWAKERPPLFPGINGRHKQRAFRDALADIIPREHHYGPTIRLDDQDVINWMSAPDAEDRMRALLRDRLLDPAE
jgi:hypothetical protein